jgi:hypothetical protein
MVAKLYSETHATAFGTDSLPGILLATSDVINASTLTSTRTLVEFTFSGAEKVTLSAGTNYVIAVSNHDGDASNNVSVGIDLTTKTHSGNSSTTTNEVDWTARTYDSCFYVYGDDAVPQAITSAHAAIAASDD